jgi:hypothetical protein
MDATKNKHTAGPSALPSRSLVGVGRRRCHQSAASGPLGHDYLARIVDVAIAAGSLSCIRAHEVAQGGVWSKDSCEGAVNCMGPHAEIFVSRTIVSLCYDFVTVVIKGQSNARWFSSGGPVGRPAAKMA